MTEINYRTQVAAQVEADAVKEKVAANDAAWNEIIDRYAIRDADDNRNMVEIFCSGVITLQKFKLLADHPPAGFNLRWSDEKTLRAELIDAILEQLHDPTGKRFTDHAAKTELRPARIARPAG